jgi:phenylpropionate dioxygenase-like ring-hydroxylating dioxygenase large terminal subunit
MLQFEKCDRQKRRYTDRNTQNLGLPGYFYTDPQIFDRELKTIWANTWQLIGRVEDVANPGDYITCMLGNEPIVVLRTQTNELLAWHNICQHRGARLLEGKGNCHAIRCPYHAWTYSQQGKLLGLPQQHLFPNLNKSDLHLISAQVDAWGGFIFVNPNPNGESLPSYLAGFQDYLQQSGYQFEALRKVMAWSYEEPINWKFIVENYVEDYHFAIAHADSLSLYDFPNVRTKLCGRHVQVLVPYTEKPSKDELADDSISKQKRLSYQGYVFPNLMVETTKNHFFIFRLIPLTPVSTRIEVVFYQTSEQIARYPLKEAKFRPSFDRVMQEDFALCRLLQEGVRSRAYRVSHLANERESGIAHFYNVISDWGIDN